MPGFSGIHRADHAHGGLAERRQFIEERHGYAEHVALDDLLHELFAEKQRVAQRRGHEAFIHDEDAAGRGPLENGMNPEQIVLQLAAQVLEVFLPLEVGEQSVEEEEPRFPAGHGTADAGQVMELSKSAGEGRFPALVRPGHDQYAFRIVEVEVVGHHRCVFADELIGQGEVEYLAAADFLGSVGDGGIAEGQPGRFEALDVLDARDVELDFPVKGPDRAVEIVAMATAVLLQEGEDVGIELVRPGPVWPLQHGSCPARSRG